MNKPSPRNFIQLRPEAETRVMHPAALILSEDPTYEVILQDPIGDDVAVGQDVLVYCERAGTFCAQPAAIRSAERVPYGMLIAIEMTGDPMPAERRRKPEPLPIGGGTAAPADPQGRGGAR